MSSLLERAIVDATALKEAALKNAENLVIEKYSDEVKDAVSQLLEQDELGLDMETPDAGMEDPLGLGGPEAPEPTEETDEETAAAEEFRDSTIGDIPDAFGIDLKDPDDQMVNINLDSLRVDLPEEEDGPFAGDDEFADDEIGIDIEDEDFEEDFEDDFEDDFDADSDFDVDTADFDADTDFDTDTGLGVDIQTDMLSEMLENFTLDEEEEIVYTPEDLIGESPIEAMTPEDEEELEEMDLVPDTDSASIDELDEMDPRGWRGMEEAVRVDFEPQKSGWAGTPESMMREYEEMLLAREQDSEIKEKNKELRKTVAALQNENKTLISVATKLEAQVEKYTTTLETLQEKLETTNVSNAKLLYINRALENASLNERQKEKIVESISKATTVQEAKIVFETLQETVTSSPAEKRVGSLNEAVSRRSTLLVGARKEQKEKSANPAFDRLQRLAGIKK